MTSEDLKLLLRRVSGVECKSPAHGKHCSVEGYPPSDSDILHATVRCPLCDVKGHLGSVVWKARRMKSQVPSQKTAAYAKTPDWYEEPHHPFHVSFTDWP